MMKLKAQLSGKEYEVSLDIVDGTAEVDVDGRDYEIKFSELSADRNRGEYLLINGTNVYKCRVESKRERISSSNSFEVVLRGWSHDITIIDPKRLRSGQSAGAQGSGAAQIVSPMPGKVVRILAQPGTTVEAGAGIVVVEAMKMQNEMKSPKAGTVVSVNAETGATVSAGDVLAVIE
jgi:biotin carboxyl carrier protein